MSKNYRSELVFLFGDPVDDNPTGAMMEAAFAACNLNYRYITVKVSEDGFDSAMNGIKQMNIKGLNFTMPHKEKAVKYMDKLSPAAKIIGAINTCYYEDGKLVGDNTDGKGFIQALANKGYSPNGKKIFILGSGGAAKAIATECALAGAKAITIANRTLEKAQSLSDVISSNTDCRAHAIRFTSGLVIPEDTDILINATSIGLAPASDKRPDIDFDSIKKGMVVSDVVFCPADSLFLKAAREIGAVCVNGLGMLVCQGVLAFELWTGIKAPQTVMAETLAKEMN